MIFKHGDKPCSEILDVYHRRRLLNELFNVKNNVQNLNVSHQLSIAMYQTFLLNDTGITYEYFEVWDPHQKCSFYLTLLPADYQIIPHWCYIDFYLEYDILLLLGEKGLPIMNILFSVPQLVSAWQISFQLFQIWSSLYLWHFYPILQIRLGPKTMKCQLHQRKMSKWAISYLCTLYLYWKKVLVMGKTFHILMIIGFRWSKFSKLCHPCFF